MESVTLNIERFSIGDMLYEKYSLTVNEGYSFFFRFSNFQIIFFERLKSDEILTLKSDSFISHVSKLYYQVFSLITKISHVNVASMLFYDLLFYGYILDLGKIFIGL